MTRRHRRLVVIAAAGVMLSLAAALVLIGLRDSVVYFFAPSEFAEKVKPGVRVKLGGLVAAGSVKREADGALLFSVSDGKGVVPVRFQGDPPDLFRESQGVVAEGALDRAGLFHADRVLAKHDERYMPKEVVEALKRSGEWRGPGAAAPARPATAAPS